MSRLEYFALLRIMGVTGASCNTTKYITPSRMIINARAVLQMVADTIVV